MRLEHLTRDAVRELLMIMFEGWRLHEASWVAGDPVDGFGGRYTREQIDCFVEAAGGDQTLGHLVSLFSEWSNDIVSMAAFYGIGFLADETFSTDLPPAPTPQHWWSEGRWMPPFELALEQGEAIAGRDYELDVGGIFRE